MTVQLISGSGTTRTPTGFRMSNYPWVYLGGTVDTLTAGVGTGQVTYYGLDNTTVDVLRLGCYKDITLSPQWNTFEDYCWGVLVRKRKLTGYVTTVTITEDLIDLTSLRWFMRQASAQHAQHVGTHIEALTIDDVVTWAMPVLFEHHYKRASSATDEYVGILCFEAEISLGDLSMDPNEGYSAELTIEVNRSDTYNGYVSLMRKDAVVIV